MSSASDQLIVKSKLVPGKVLEYEPTDKEFIFSFKPSPTLTPNALKAYEQKIIGWIEHHEKHNKDNGDSPLVAHVSGVNGVWGFARVVIGTNPGDKVEAISDLQFAASKAPGNFITAFVDKNEGFSGKLRYFLPNRLLVKVKPSVSNLVQPFFPGHKNHIISWFEGQDEDGNEMHAEDGKLIEVEVPDEKGKSKQKVLMEQSEKYENHKDVVYALAHQVGFDSALWEPWDDHYRSYLQWGFKNDGSYPSGAVSGTDMKVKNAWNTDASGNSGSIGRTTAEGLGNYGTPEVLVAIIDNGIDSDHGSLSSSFASSSSTDCSGSGTTLPPAGGTSHGTALAGICVAKKVNSSSDVARYDWPVVGMAPLSKFMTLKINTSAYSVSEVECAINYVKNKADFNNGVNGKRYVLLIAHEFAYDLAIDNALEDAMNSGVLVVCAGGNTGNATLAYPASCGTTSAANRLISVGAIKADNTRWSSSSTACNVYAPGANIYSTLNGGVAGLSYTGTSIAAAFIAGAAAVLWSRDFRVNGSFTRNATNIKSIIMTPGFRVPATGGFQYLNLGAAVGSIV
jgi:hypothetical protein